MMNTTTNADDSNGGSAMPQSVETIKQMFQEAGIKEYEPQLLFQMCDVAYALTKQILGEARSVSEFSGKKQVDKSDVDFALKAFNEKYYKNRPSKAFMAELAAEKNTQPLPPIRQNYGLRLPNDRFCQLQQNYAFVGIGGGADEATTSSSRMAEEDMAFAPPHQASRVQQKPPPQIRRPPQTAAMNNFNPETVSNLLMGRPAGAGTSAATEAASSRKRPYPEEEENNSQQADMEDDEDYD